MWTGWLSLDRERPDHLTFWSTWWLQSVIVSCSSILSVWHSLRFLRVWAKSTWKAHYRVEITSIFCMWKACCWLINEEVKVPDLNGQTKWWTFWLLFAFNPYSPSVTVEWRLGSAQYCFWVVNGVGEEISRRKSSLLKSKQGIRACDKAQKQTRCLVTWQGTRANKVSGHVTRHKSKQDVLSRDKAQERTRCLVTWQGTRANKVSGYMTRYMSKQSLTRHKSKQGVWSPDKAQERPWCLITWEGPRANKWSGHVTRPKSKQVVWSCDKAQEQTRGLVMWQGPRANKWSGASL